MARAKVYKVENVGRLLRGWLDTEEISVETFAKKIKVTPVTVYKILRESSVKKIQHLMAIQSATGLSFFVKIGGK